MRSTAAAAAATRPKFSPRPASEREPRALCDARVPLLGANALLAIVAGTLHISLSPRLGGNAFSFAPNPWRALTGEGDEDASDQGAHKIRRVLAASLAVADTENLRRTAITFAKNAGERDASRPTKDKRVHAPTMLYRVLTSTLSLPTCLDVMSMLSRLYLYAAELTPADWRRCEELLALVAAVLRYPDDSACEAPDDASSRTPSSSVPASALVPNTDAATMADAAAAINLVAHAAAVVELIAAAGATSPPAAPAALGRASHTRGDAAAAPSRAVAMPAPSPAPAPSPTIVLAFLVSGEFWTRDVWLHWLEGAAGIGVALHVSNVSPAEGADIAAWTECLSRKGHTVAIAPSRPTAWAHPSLLRAQLALFDACAAAFPAATHYLLLSEKCVPLVSPSRLLSFCATTIARASAFNFFVPVACPALVPLQNDLLRRFGVHYKAGAQFMLLHAGQYAAVAQLAAQVVDAYKCAMDWSAAAAASVYTVPMDEWVLHSVLWSAFGAGGWHYAEVVYAHFAPCSVRASVMPPSWTATGLRSCVARAALDCHWLAARKVRPSAQVVDTLQELGVLSGRDERASCN